jgi:glycosyltransferase involved in cell wall biosynthesis
MIENSIIIPVKDDTYIFSCLVELINIKDKKTEIIIVNDLLSSKNFSDKLKSFCKKERLNYIRAKKPGASANRNLGMDAAKGINIIFIDSDCRPSQGWIKAMAKTLRKFNVVEGAVIYDSKIKGVLDRVVENKKTPNRFLTANLGIKREVAKSCKFDERFFVFREDTDFGFSALEKGFSSSFNQKAIVFHKKAKFGIKRFITERKRYIGEALFLKKHLLNKNLNKEVKRIWRILYPSELIFILGMFVSLAIFIQIFPLFYLFPGGYYLYKKKSQGFTLTLKESSIVLLLLPITMLVKRFSIWLGALRFNFFVI